MGLHKTTKTIPMPKGAAIRNGTVTWTNAKGERKTGKLSASNRILVESPYWQVR